MKKKNNKIAQSTKLTLLSFFILILLGGFLLNLPISNAPGMSHDFLNSLFTSCASVCVAGLSTVVAGEQYTLFRKDSNAYINSNRSFGFYIYCIFVLFIDQKEA